MVVYSRWCGELISDIQHCGAKRGLSPLARGTRHMPDHMCSNGRFIPAGAGNSRCMTGKPQTGAGNSRCMTGKPQTGAVYPRWRGELAALFSLKTIKLGLSPLARGTLISLAIINRLTRFIPAGAGNSRARGDSGRACTVYPRWRGELAGMLRSVFDKLGLSPLARGTQGRGDATGSQCRFIPAGAGNSLNITYY